MPTRPTASRSNSHDSRKYMVVRSNSDGQLQEFEQVPIPQHVPVPPIPGSIPGPSQPTRQRQNSQAHSAGHYSAQHSRQSSVARTAYTARSRAGSTTSSREHSRAPSRAPSAHRSRTHTAASSSDGSVSSESEFLTYRDGEHQPLVAGLQYGPYSYLNYPQNMAAERQYSQESFRYTELTSNSSQGQTMPPLQQYQAPGMYPGTSVGSHSSYSSTHMSQQYAPNAAGRPSMRYYSSTAPSSSGHDSATVISQVRYTANHALETHFLYDTKTPEADDHLHNPSQHDAVWESGSCSIMNIRGVCNVLAMVVILMALIGVFAIYPVIHEISLRRLTNLGGFGLGGKSSTLIILDMPLLKYSPILT